MRPVLAAVTAATLAACAAVPMAETPSSAASTAANGNDCAVIAAVAREQFKLGPGSEPMQVTFGEGFDPGCDWVRLGLNLTPRVADANADPRQAMRVVSFDRPRYDGQGALIAVGIIFGPLAGQGYECRVRSGFAGWTVAEGDCQNTWVS